MDIQPAIDLLIKFRDERNWKQFHNTKDLALALSIEAAELNELFLWKNGEETDKVDIQKIKSELADILAYALLITEKYQFDLNEIIAKKVQENELKYPVEKSRNNSSKYNEL